MKAAQLGPFAGLNTSLSPQDIQPHQSPTLSNVMVENGLLQCRRGWREVSDWQDSFPLITTPIPYMMGYVFGYNGAYEFVEEYVTVLNDGAHTRAYAGTVDSGVWSELTATDTAGATVHVELPATGTWSWVSYSGWGFIINPDGTDTSIWRWSIGAHGTFTKIIAPLPPLSAPGIATTYGQGGTVTPGLTAIDFTGAPASAFAWIIRTPFGQASGNSAGVSGPSSGLFTVSPCSNTLDISFGTVHYEVTMDLSQWWGEQDYSDANAFQIDIQYTAGGIANARLVLVNHAGDELPATTTAVNFFTNSSGLAIARWYATWPDTKTGDFTQIKYIRMIYDTILPSGAWGASNLIFVGTVKLFGTPEPGGGTAYQVFPWTGVNTTTHIDYTGVAQASGSSVSGGNLIIHHTGAGNATFKVKLDTASLTQNWVFNDVFACTLTYQGVTIDPATIFVTFRTSDGGVFTASILTAANLGGDAVRMAFDNKGPDRLSWNLVTSIEFDYSVSAVTGAGTITFTPLTVGGVDLQYGADGSTANVDVPQSTLRFAYSYVNLLDGSNGLESALSPDGTIDNQNAVLGSPPYAGFYLGSILQVTAQLSSDANADLIRYYVFDYDSESYVLFGTTQNLTASVQQLYRINPAEWATLPEFNGNSFRTDGCLSAFQYNAWVVWLYKGGYQNVRHSRIANPLAQSGDTSNTLGNAAGDATAGATVSMAHGYGDEPVCGFPVGDGVILLGAKGAYTQIAQRAVISDSVAGFRQISLTPTMMGPSQKMPESKGCAGRHAAVVWRTSTGHSSVAYLTPDGELYNAVMTSTDGEGAGLFLEEVSHDIRGYIVSFLQGSEDDLSGVWMAVDESCDALWIVLANRALVLRRPSLIDGRRYFEAYTYNLNQGMETGITMPFGAPSPTWRLRTMLSNAVFAELEWDSSDYPTFEPIDGANRDGGNTVVATWTGKIMNGPNRTLDRILVDREDLTDLYSVQDVTERATVSETVQSGRQYMRFPISGSSPSQGWNHQFTITVPETADPLNRLQLEYNVAGPRRNA